MKQNILVIMTTHPCLLRMLWACCSMTMSPEDTPCLVEEREWCLLSLGELGGIPVTEESFAGPLAAEDDVTSMYEAADDGSGGATLR